MHRTARVTGLLVFLLLAAAPKVHAAKVSSSLTYDSRMLVTTLWYPDDLKVIRGVLVFTGGQGSGVSGDTRGLVNNPFWQRFAQSVGFGVLGNQFTGTYTNAADATGKALLDSLKSLADKSGHPELEHAPLLVEGFSNGGYFSYTFAQSQPARVIAFCLNKSGFARAPLDDTFLAVPGLLLWGSDEPGDNVPTVVHSLVTQGRMKHALWAEAIDWGAGHEEGKADRLFAPFFADMIGMRYPNGKSPVDGPVALLPLSEADGWIGDHSDPSVSSNLPKIASFAAYGGDKAAASWLPSEDLANLWRGFVTKNPLELSAPSSGAQLDANAALQLSVSGIANGETANFYDGAMEIASGSKPASGTAKATWMPAWGGVRGIVAHALSGSGELTRTSLPANVVLSGKDAPALPQANPSGGGGTGSAGRAAAGSGNTSANAGRGSNAGTAATMNANAGKTGGNPASAAGSGGAGADAGAGTITLLEQNNGCSVQRLAASGNAWWLALLWLGVLARLLRRRHTC